MKIMRLFCRHKNKKWIGKYDDGDVFYCPDCDKYQWYNKYVNFKSGWVRAESAKQ